MTKYQNLQRRLVRLGLAKAPVHYCTKGGPDMGTCPACATYMANGWEEHISVIRVNWEDEPGEPRPGTIVLTWPDDQP